MFAGAIYQAALELIDQDVKRDRIKSVASTIKPPAIISPLWWFLPPVKIFLEQRRSRQYQEQYIRALLPEDVEAFISFTNKSTAWLTVATGGLLIAMERTYALCETWGVSLFVFWVVFIGAGFMSALYTVIRISRGRNIIEAAKKSS